MNENNLNRLIRKWKKASKEKEEQLQKRINRKHKVKKKKLPVEKKVDDKYDIL